MTDGRIYELEDEIDVIHEDLGRARRHLYQLERAEMEGRVADHGIYRHEVRKATERVLFLERQLAEACADQIAAGEGFDT